MAKSVPIRIDGEIRDALKGRKVHKRETYSDIIERLLKKERKKTLKRLLK